MKTETQTAHTPGIWKVSKSPKNGYNVHDSSQNWIARINDLGNGEANASLIAAAPELLAACKKLAAVKNIPYRGILEAAIAKAESR